MPRHSDYQIKPKQRNHNIHEASSSSHFSDETITLPHHSFNSDLIRQQVKREFIWQGHMDAIEKASKIGNFAVSFRAAGAPTLRALSKGAAAKGHDILEKTIKPGSINKAYPKDQAPDVIRKVQAAGIEGYVGHWNKETGQLQGVYMSRDHGLSDGQVNGKIYPIDLDNLETSLSALKEKKNWAALPFTGDYDMHDMISFTGQPHSVPSASSEEKRIIDLINQYIAKSDINRPFNKIEHNVIRHGPQVSYPAFAMDQEKEEIKKHGGIVKAVAEPGEFPVAIVSKGKWTIANNINELNQFYNSIGAKMKVSWKPDADNPGFVSNSQKPGMANFNRKR
ncbi:Insecticial toxin [Xenorhabdus lircayensis]|uniref:Insecticial toxin n=1 Tax=Xenorhabdus lircayensis TaxID=2763499 RepID=A0ABS0UA27_9GAMM|nr:Insecticial toxin [Xenorhabdus lircayensis]MBI6549636.1 Insecticial toxin [Xenorhabdus lircayensis]